MNGKIGDLKMELKEGTSVFTASGEEVGKINRVVLDPATNEVTHIVVQKGWLLPEDKVVPLRMVSSATEEKVVLNEDTGDFEQLPPFEETHYVELPEGDTSPAKQSNYRYAPAYYLYPPSGYTGYPAYGLGYYGWPPIVTQQNIPENTIPLKEGSKVISSDDEHVGDIERLIVDPDSNRATHFLISQGLLFRERKLVPADWVRSVEEDRVHLAVPSKLLERLPAHEYES
jgi:uncharacterized protein YrrD